jgi:hypothetical protein
VLQGVLIRIVGCSIHYGKNLRKFMILFILKRDCFEVDPLASKSTYPLEFLQRKQLADAIGKRSNAVLDNIVSLRTLFVIMSQSMDNDTQERFLVNVQACSALDFSTREMISRSLGCGHG